MSEILEELKKSMAKINTMNTDRQWPIAVSFSPHGYHAVSRNAVDVQDDPLARSFGWPVYVWPRQIEPMIIHRSEEEFLVAFGKYAEAGDRLPPSMRPSVDRRLDLGSDKEQ